VEDASRSEQPIEAAEVTELSESVPASESAPTPPAPTHGAIDAPPPPPPPSGLEGLSQAPKTPDERKVLLANTLQGQVASGARIESQGEFQAVVVRGHRPNHLLHFLIGIFTLGLWWIVWFFIALFGGEKRQMINVDQFGNVFVQKV
jgi:hypothetical protein